MKILFTGAISCKSVLENAQRHLEHLYVNKEKRSRDFAYIIAIAKQKQVPITLMSKEAFQKQFGQAAGIALEAGIREYPDLKEISNVQGLCVFVSGIEDPYNLGSTCRSLYAAGASLLILNRRDWKESEAILQKASAGAWDKMPIAMIERDEDLVAWATGEKLPMVAAARDQAVSLFETEFAWSTLLIIGGALRGVSRTLLEASHHVYIPYGRDFRNALDTPSAAAVMAFAWTRQFALQLEEGQNK